MHELIFVCRETHFVVNSYFSPLEVLIKKFSQTNSICVDTNIKRYREGERVLPIILIVNKI